MNIDKKAFIKYLCALLLFGLNGIVASHIALSSSEIVFLRTMIGSLLLIILFLVSGGRFHFKSNSQDVIFIVLSGMAMGTSWMFLYEAYQQIGVSFASPLYFCGPVLVMILSPVIFKEKLTLPKVLGLLNTGLGCYLYFSPLSKLPVQTGLFRECYIDGIWNKDSVEDWLTEIQFPI